jgi:uncharacterized protein YbcC (UPF0753/DUF2309 family)
MTDKIAETLDLVPLVEGDGFLEPLKDDEGQLLVKHEEIDNEYDEVKNNLKIASEFAQDAMQRIDEIAANSQTARDYEVLTKAIKTFADVNKDILEAKKAKAEATKGEVKEEPKNVTNNLFVGTTADLLRQIENKVNEDE